MFHTRFANFSHTRHIQMLIGDIALSTLFCPFFTSLHFTFSSLLSSFFSLVSFPLLSCLLFSFLFFSFLSFYFLSFLFLCFPLFYFVFDCFPLLCFILFFLFCFLSFLSSLFSSLLSSRLLSSLFSSLSFDLKGSMRCSNYRITLQFIYSLLIISYVILSFYLPSSITTTSLSGIGE